MCRPVQGLIQGVIKLLSNTIVGLSEWLAWVFGTVAMIVARGSGDRTFVLRRRNLMRSRPRHIIDGVLLAVLVAMTAITSGIYGVKDAFAIGCSTGSFSKFGEGLGLGIIGFFLKPLAGAFDGCIMLLHGIGKTLAVLGSTRQLEARTRKRQPRLFHVDGQLRPVNQEESDCQNVITQLGFTDEIFVSNIRFGEYMMIVTSARLIFYLWDDHKIKDQNRTRATRIAMWALLLGLGLGLSVGIALKLRLVSGGMQLGLAGGIGLGLAGAAGRILVTVGSGKSSPWQVGKVLFQSNLQWQITWSILEAVVLELPPTARPQTRSATTQNDAAQVVHPRMRFRLRLRRSCWPEQLEVSQAGVVTNFSGLTLQAATAQMFIWDTIRRRRTREIVLGTEHADGLLKLYDVLMQLKIRHQSLLEKNPGKIKGIGLLDEVDFTDTTTPVGPEWEWATVRRRGVNAGLDFRRIDDNHDQASLCPSVNIFILSLLDDYPF
eukprot:SAG11_NODE_882_length_6739_cov_1.990211_3_plen_490_part_00